jgi:pantetheine-phosphate adenylyltransferase
MAPSSSQSPSGRHALFPGTFDPVTLGHLDLVRRGLSLFDTVTVAVASHHDKRHLFSLEERIDLIEASFAEVNLTDGASATSLPGLVVRGCADLGATAILRGLRGAVDLEYEVAMLQTNRALAPDVETVLLVPSPDLVHISSTLVRQVGVMGGDVSDFVTHVVAQALEKRFRGEQA